MVIKVRESEKRVRSFGCYNATENQACTGSLDLLFMLAKKNILLCLVEAPRYQLWISNRLQVSFSGITSYLDQIHLFVFKFLQSKFIKTYIK